MSEEAAQTAASLIEARFPDFDLELYNGKQSIYSYILSVE